MEGPERAHPTNRRRLPARIEGVRKGASFVVNLPCELRAGEPFRQNK
ncbi:MAG: hypothetical protein HXY18_00740 [Bryobacteraceae bacterium]|nr:hypothetical protein [Bryobacteraceae bacterium]